MIKKLFSFSLMFFLIGLISCEDSDNTPPVVEPEVILKVDLTSFEFDSDGGTKPLQVTSNELWRFEYDTDLWARPSIQTTRGDATIQIIADENESTDPRSMSITLTAEGADDVTINISQVGREPDSVEPEKPDYIEPDNTDMRNLTSIQLTELMGVGWNLGNSLEAINVSGDNFTGGETSWGNPRTTKEFVDAVKNAGFNTIRIPVSWSHMIDDENESTFYISYEWKQRVEEVINYALDNDMFVMINIHWDGGWMNQPTYANQDEINTKLTAFWKQIAKYFRDYDDRLLFAGTNEVHVQDNYNEPSQENVNVQNSFNQTFVNTVRATGGRNTYRHLVVQSYNTNIEWGEKYMVIPEDDTDDRLMVEVHFYDPYQFTLQEDGVALWGQEHSGSSAHSGWGDEAWVDEIFARTKAAFVDQGYGVILGEYAATLRENPENTTYQEHIQARNYYLNYVTKIALENGMVPVYWDNGDTDDNGSGLFNRATGAKVHEGAIEAITSAMN